MFVDKLQGKALKKMAAAILPNFLESPMMAQMVESVIAKIVEQKNKVELLPGEVEVCLLISNARANSLFRLRCSIPATALPAMCHWMEISKP